MFTFMVLTVQWRTQTKGNHKQKEIRNCDKFYKKSTDVSDRENFLKKYPLSLFKEGPSKEVTFKLLERENI